MASTTSSKSSYRSSKSLNITKASRKWYPSNPPVPNKERHRINNIISMMKHGKTSFAAVPSIPKSEEKMEVESAAGTSSQRQEPDDKNAKDDDSVYLSDDSESIELISLLTTESESGSSVTNSSGSTLVDLEDGESGGRAHPPKSKRRRLVQSKKLPRLTKCQDWVNSGHISTAERRDDEPPEPVGTDSEDNGELVSPVPVVNGEAGPSTSGRTTHTSTCEESNKHDVETIELDSFGETVTATTTKETVQFKMQDASTQTEVENVESSVRDIETQTNLGPLLMDGWTNTLPQLAPYQSMAVLLKNSVSTLYGCVSETAIELIFVPESPQATLNIIVAEEGYNYYGPVNVEEFLSDPSIQLELASVSHSPAPVAMNAEASVSHSPAPNVQSPVSPSPPYSPLTPVDENEVDDTAMAPAGPEPVLTVLENVNWSELGHDYHSDLPPSPPILEIDLVTPDTPEANNLIFDYDTVMNTIREEGASSPIQVADE